MTSRDEVLQPDELATLVERVFRPRGEDSALAFLIDLPDERLADNPPWAARRRLVASWQRGLRDSAARIGLEQVDLICYRNARRNNADLPAGGSLHVQGELPDDAESIVETERSFEEIFSSYSILVAVTELSATAPLKLAAPRHGFRAATMPGFRAEMIPALRLDYEEIHRRCVELKALLDVADSAHVRTRAAGKEYELTIDLRFRLATASGGLVREAGTAGNLPSGESYIVPYEGERSGESSRTAGVLPLQLEGELLYYRIEGNRVCEVLGDGPRAREERAAMDAEPAYRNVAELGLGVLAAYGIKPVGSLLLDEKLGLHIAFGRSDHFGGQVGAADFSSPDRVVHIDRVYLPEVQPAVELAAVDLQLEQPGGTRSHPLMRNGSYV